MDRDAQTRPPMTAGPIERALSAVGSTIAPESAVTAGEGAGLPSNVFFFAVCCAESAPGNIARTSAADTTTTGETHAHREGG